MINLYSRLSSEWDILFPPDPDRHEYLTQLLGRGTPGGLVVEVGCGTGSTAGFLQSLGYAVRASDLDPEMIALAGSDGYPGVEFFTAGMLDALKSEDAGSALGVLCLGNTLPHLADMDEVRRFFREASRILRPGGVVLLQILNYLRIIESGVVTMPELRSGGLTFSRKQVYRHRCHRVEFHTKVDDGSRTESRSHSMLPLLVEDLVEAARVSGLGETDTGSGWNISPAGPDSTWFRISFRKADA